MTSAKLLFVANTSYYLYNFRRGLLSALKSRGYQVIVAAPIDAYSERLTELGFEFVPLLALHRKGINPVNDLRLMLELYRIYQQVSPEVVFTFTIKPNIYGAFAAALAGVASVSTVTGLGHTFRKKGILNLFVRGMYLASMACNSKVVFQNSDDLSLFIDAGLVSAEKVERSPGSGVDLDYFAGDSRPIAPPRFILISRMLKEKGVLEFSEAAALVKRTLPDVEFCLLGPVDCGNPSCVALDEIQRLERDGNVVYLGEAVDVRPYIAGASAVILPSVYREGVPKILLESMAMAKPIITTDSVGCRETVDDGRNGYLLPTNSPEAIATAVLKFISLSEADQEVMGLTSLAKARHEFDERIVIDLYDRLTLETINLSGGDPVEMEVA